MNEPFRREEHFARRWRHVFKLDPEKTLTDEQLARICSSGTDALLIGGFDGCDRDEYRRLITKAPPTRAPPLAPHRL